MAFVGNRDLPPGSIDIPLSKWVEPVTQDELLACYEGWGPDVMILLNHITKPSRWSIHSVDPPLESFVHQKVVLVGDAVSRCTSQ